MKRIVLATIGSWGDLHPCLALAMELHRRGHSVTIASTELYRAKVEELGIAFHAIRPNWELADGELVRQCEDLKRGLEILYRRLLLPHLKDTYEDLLSAARDADLMIAGELVYAAPLVAEQLSLRWVSAILSPFSFFSSHDPSVLVSVPWLAHLHRAGWPAYRLGLNICKLANRHWSNPVRRLRREIRLSPDCDPVFRDKFSPDLVLALFSRMLAQPQPDWPPQTLQSGFIFHDGHNADTHCATELSAFLASGEAPIVFTLGSTAVHNPGDFYRDSVAAAKRLGRRAVLIGADRGVATELPEILALPYAPYSRIFPDAAVIVHQGGSGTTGQALRAARPMLIVPYGWDQPDNGARVQRLGVGLCLSRREYSATTAAAALKRLLEGAHFAQRAAEAGSRQQEENGLALACDAVESVLTSGGPKREC